MFRRIFSSVVTSLVAFGIVALAGPLQAQAAVNVSPWVRTSGTALADEFETIMARGGMEPVTIASESGSASVLLGGAGAGLLLGTKGLQLYSKITTGSWDTYTEGLSCGSDWVGKAADFVGKAFKIMSFGFGGYSCATAPGAVKTADLPTVDLSNPTVDKAPVPDPPVPAYRIDYTREYQIKGGTPQCNVTFSVQIHFTGYDKDGFIADVTNSNSFPISSAPNSQTICAFGVQMYGYAVYFDGNGLTQLSYAGARTIASGETVHDLKFGIKSVMSGFPDSSAGKKVQCIGSDYKDGYSLKNCLGVTPQGTSVSTKGDNDTMERQISCRVTATDGTHIDAPGDTYSDSSGIPLDSEKWGCKHAWQQTINAGKIPQRVTATSTFPGAVGDPQVLLNQPVTPDVQKEVTDSPECVSASSNSAGCVKRLYKRVGGQLRSCADADVWDSCADWLSESETSPDLYVCKYGNKTVELSECAMYAPTFRYPQADTDLHYQTDQDSDTAIDTSGAAQAEPDSENCWAQMISWNPIDWVLTPVKCSLSWAFKPDPDVISQGQLRLQDNLRSSFVQDISDAYTAALPTGDETQCLGPKVSVSAFGYSLIKDSHPLSVCPGSGLDMLPKIFRLAVTALAGFGGFILVKKQISSLLGFDDGSSVSGKTKS